MKESTVIGDNSSKRAFPLDSRAIWVEQMIDKHGTVVHRDNLINGPGEYEPKLASSKHISTPSLGKHISPFKTFKSSVGRPDLNSFNNSTVSSIPYQKQNLLPQNSNENIYERNEMLTVYHGHDKMRHALDPKLRYTNTPGPYTTHQPILEAVKYNGKVSPQKVFFGPDNIPFGERGGQDIKIALPDYVPNFDSKYVRKSIILSKISPSERFSYNKKNSSPDNKNKLSGNGSISSLSQVSSTNNSKNIIDELITRSRTPSPNSSRKKASIFHVPSARDNQTVIDKKSFAAEGDIKKPKLKFRVWPKLTFDSSCYDNYKKPMPSGLTPAAIDKAIQLHPFERMLKTKKLYRSSMIGSRISDKIKRASSPILYR